MIFMLLSFPVQANCDSEIATLHTKKFDIDIFYGDGCGGDPKIEFTKNNKKLSAPFNKECAFHNKDNGFSCHASGSTPLAGATYNFVKYGKSNCSCAEPNDPGHRYVCIKGCSSSTPQYLEVSDQCC